MNKKTNTTDSGITRRDFLKLGGATVAGAAAFGTAQGADVKVKSAGTSPGIGGNQVYSVCPYCAVGCGMKISDSESKMSFTIYCSNSILSL